MYKRNKSVKQEKSVHYNTAYNNVSFENEKSSELSIYASKSISARRKFYKSESEKTFEEVILLWLDSNRIRIKESSVFKYEYIIRKHILPEYKDVKISSVNTSDINLFLENKQKSGRIVNHGELSSSYVKTIMHIVKSVMAFAVEQGFCEPLRGKINRPYSEKKELKLIDCEYLKRIELYAIRTKDFTSLGILISVYTGMRIGEICALRWDDIDIANGVIHVRHTVARIKNDEAGRVGSSKNVICTPKTRSSKRDIPILSVLMPYICDMKKRAVSDYVVSDNDEFVNLRTFEYRYHKVLKTCGIPDINYHALRHTFATRCVVAGVDIKSLSEILGHANATVTLNTYVHSSLEMKKNQIEKLCNLQKR